MAARPATVPLALWLGLGAFVAVLAYVVATSLAPREALEFAPSAVSPGQPQPKGLVFDTVTVDARDPTAWVFFDFDRRSVVAPPDTAGWDLAFRRFNVVPAEAAADLGPVAFEDLTVAPVSGFVASEFTRDTVNTAINRWYRYSMLSHLLSSKKHTYVIRSRQHRFAKVDVISYYCPGVEPGCLTFRYVYQPDGSRELS
jgi:HmuY protein